MTVCVTETCILGQLSGITERMVLFCPSGTFNVRRRIADAFVTEVNKPHFDILRKHDDENMDMCFELHCATGKNLFK